MLSRTCALGFIGIAVASGLALGCAQSIEDPLVQDDVGVVGDSRDAGPSPTNTNRPPPAATPDAGTSAPPKDAATPREEGSAPPDAVAPPMDAAVGTPDTGSVTSVACVTTGINGIRYAAEFLGAVNPCPCAATECCYQTLLCVAR